MPRPASLENWDHLAMTLLLGTPFESAGELEAFRGSDGGVVLDSPHLRFANPRDIRLNPHGLGPFSRLIVPALPDQPGAYAISSADQVVLYVGRARDSLRRRWGRGGYAVIDPRNCFVGGQSTNCHINGLITAGLCQGEGYTLSFHTVDPPDDLERRLRSGLRPIWNLQI
jgi:hypothetical protein